ncbi:PASTA domain-containing protein, partial [Streptomyces zhihengii]
ADSMAETGATVTLTVAKEAKQDLPNVVGQQFANAKSQLEIAEFEVVRQDVDSDQPKDTVVAQDPQPGKVTKGTKVTLQVSKGPAQTQSPVPVEILGKRLGEAKQILAQAGFTNVSVAPGNPGDDNAIVRNSNPTPGTPVDPATTPVVLETFGGGGNGNGGGGFIGGNDG